MAISVEAATETAVTNRLFLRKFQYGMPMTLPSMTVRKFASVGWASRLSCSPRSRVPPPRRARRAPLVFS